MWPICDELRKHRAFREVWVGYLLGGAYLLLGVWNDSVSNCVERWWYFIQQDIYAYGNTLTAFLLVTGLARLMCCEGEYGTGRLIRTAKRGPFLVWRSKALFAIGYCAVVVLVVGSVSLLVHGSQAGWREALDPVSEAVAFVGAPLPISNLGYCVTQYIFLFLGAVYFAGFVLLTAQLTRRTALTIFLCGGAYLALWAYFLVGFRWVQNTPLGPPLSLLFEFSFVGFMSLENFSTRFSAHFITGWGDVWRPAALAVALAGAEFAVSWLLWKRRART